MRTLDAALIAAKNSLDSDDPWLALLEITHEGWEVLYYDGLSASFHEGETVTGGTSGASCEVYFVSARTLTSGYLITGEITSGPFQDDEDLDGDHSTSPGAATVTTPIPAGDGEAVLRFARNVEDVTYETYTWEKFNFFMDMFVDSASEIPSVSISVSNANRFVEGVVSKGDGFIGDQVRLLFVYAGDLSANPAIDEYFNVKSVVATEEVVSFVLGIRNPLLDVFPSCLYNRKICRFKFKDSDCGYSGGETTCNKTMTDCLARNNESNFGGFPAIPGNFFDF
jgi:hypothetical protein